MATPKASRSQKRRMKADSICRLCDGRQFGSKDGLMKHIKATPGHSLHECRCDGCRPAFLVLHANKETRLHRTDRPPPQTISCEACSTILLVCTEGKRKHRRLKGHVVHALENNLYCEDAGRAFFSGAERVEHFKKLHKADAPKNLIGCVDCEEEFESECALDAHFRTNAWHGKRKPEFRCEPCQKSFKSDKELQTHTSSKKHRPYRCIVSSLCKKRHKCFSGMVAHFESGSCVSGWDRRKIALFLHENDTENIVMKPSVAKKALEPVEIAEQDITAARPRTQQRARDNDETVQAHEVLAEDSEDSDDDEDGGIKIYTPTSSRPISPKSLSLGICTPIDLDEVQELPSFICPKCPVPRRFISAKGLQDHLLSAAHIPKLYYCPTFLFPITGGSVRRQKQRSFKALGGLVAHLESGACVGGKGSLDTAISFLEGKLKDLGLTQRIQLGQFRLKT